GTQHTRHERPGRRKAMIDTRTADANPADELLDRIRAIGEDERAREQRLHQRGIYSESATDRAAHHERLEHLATLIAALDNHLATGGPLPQAWTTPGEPRRQSAAPSE
ncbi:hypothetical protein, partial [Nocardia barduliensis]|uniref:hypothetical protein n=1 Tax=Nocardia barduliensis TaxID=2736643 RepID=UPI001C2D580B